MLFLRTFCAVCNCEFDDLNVLSELPNTNFKICFKMWKVQNNLSKCLLYISSDILKYWGGSSSRGYLGFYIHLFSETQQISLKKKKNPSLKKGKLLSNFYLGSQ